MVPGGHGEILEKRKREDEVENVRGWRDEKSNELEGFDGRGESVECDETFVVILSVDIHRKTFDVGKGRDPSTLFCIRGCDSLRTSNE